MSFDHLRECFTDRRKAIGRSQVDIARAMGTTQSAVSDLESGRTKDPGLNTLARWASAVDLSFAVQLAEVVTTTFPIVPQHDEPPARLASGETP